MEALLQADAPCCGLGLVEIEARQCGFLALRPGEPIPPDATARGFKLGHSLYGSNTYEVVHFAFEFYGFQQYHVLINPNNPVVQTVLQTMLDGGDYFFFAIDERLGSVTAFRTDLGYNVLLNLKNDWERLQHSTTTELQYRQTVTSFVDDPEYPPGTLLNWVCRDDSSYLDLSTNRLALTPASS